MFSYVSAERRVPVDHPLRSIRARVDVALKGMSRSFGQMYPDWNGSTQGGLTSLAMLLAPGDYTLTFDLNGSQRNTATSTTVTLGSFINSTILQNSTDFSNQVFNFTVISPTSVIWCSQATHRAIRDLFWTTSCCRPPAYRNPLPWR